MTITEPIEICFAEEIIEQNGIRLRVLGDKDEKQIALKSFKQNN